ncbi:pilus assembly protein CpaA [Pseudomonas sp. ODNR1LW]|nr:pilus assembly protein CpaA [Pseudomonas sp. ODNR1LW]
MDSILLLTLGLMPAFVIIGGLHDLVTMKIPNWISAALVILFFPVALASGLGLTGMGVHVGVAVLALLIGMGMFALNWIGGGDAKLIAASCLWLGWSGSAMFLFWTAVAGGLFCLALILARQHLQFLVPRSPGWVARLLEPKGHIPYGVAIAIGALLAFPEADLMSGFLIAR